MDLKSFSEALGQEGVFARLALVIAIVVAALLAWLIVVMAVRRAAARLTAAIESGPPPVRRRQQRALTALGLTANLAKWTITVACGLVVVAAVGLAPKLAPLLAGAGIVGVAVGFGSQALVRDVISGLFLLLEGQYAVGDYVTASGLSGRVVSIGLRVTALQDSEGQLHYVPNGGITTVTVRDEPWLPMFVDVTVAAKDAERAAAAVARVAEDTARQYEQGMRTDGAAEVVGGDEWAVVRVPVVVFLGREWLAKEELAARLKAAMTTLEIGMPPDRMPQAYIRATRTAYGLEETAAVEGAQQ